MVFCPLTKQSLTASSETKVPYSQRYLVLGLVVLVGLGLPLLLRLGLVELALWSVSGRR